MVEGFALHCFCHPQFSNETLHQSAKRTLHHYGQACLYALIGVFSLSIYLFCQGMIFFHLLLPKIQNHTKNAT